MRSKKTVPAKNSEAIFWRSRFTKPLRAGKRANANFACSEGFFCVRRAAPYGGLAVLARPAAVAAAFAPGCPGVCSLLQPWRPCVRLAAIVSAFCGVVFRPTRRLPLLCPACVPPAAFVFGLLCPGACLSFVRCAQRAQDFCCFFTRSSRKALPFSAGVPLLCSRSEGLTFCRCCGGFCTRACLPAVRFVCAHFFLIFRLFLPHFFLSNLFSLVAQAATGLYFLPKRK